MKKKLRNLEEYIFQNKEYFESNTNQNFLNEFIETEVKYIVENVSLEIKHYILSRLLGYYRDHLELKTYEEKKKNYSNVMLYSEGLNGKPSISDPNYINKYIEWNVGIAMRQDTYRFNMSNWELNTVGKILNPYYLKMQADFIMYGRDIRLYLHEYIGLPNYNSNRSWMYLLIRKFGSKPFDSVVYDTPSENVSIIISKNHEVYKVLAFDDLAKCRNVYKPKPNCMIIKVLNFIKKWIAQNYVDVHGVVAGQPIPDAIKTKKITMEPYFYHIAEQYGKETFTVIKFIIELLGGN